MNVPVEVQFLKQHIPGLLNGIIIYVPHRLKYNRAVESFFMVVGLSKKF